MRLGGLLGLALVAGCLVWACGRRGAEGGAIEWAFSYDAEGRLEEVVDPAGRKLAYRYLGAEDGRLQAVEKRLDSGRKVVSRYDEHGRREALEDATGRTRFGWDGFDRLVAVDWADGTGLQRGFDSLGRLSSVEIGGARLRFAYDHLGRLDRLSSPAGEIAYAYQPAQGFQVRTLPNGIRTVWSYRPDGSLESIAHVLPDDRLIARFAYRLGDDGRIAAVEEWSPGGTRTLRYAYDAAGRLAGVEDSRWGERRFRYDPLGNRLETAGRDGAVASAYDPAGRLTEHAGAPAAHDAAGNLAALPAPGGAHRFEFDDQSRLAEASGAGARVRYLHDGDGALVRRSTGAGEQRFYADPDGDTWRPWLAVDRRGRSTVYLWEGDVPLAAVTDGEVRYFLADHLGSNRIVVDQSGAIVARRDYLPFGAPAAEPPDGPPQGPFAPGFAGLFYDSDAGLYLTRARAYEPALGRFLQREPVPAVPPRSAADLAAYLYAAGDPVNSRDASGLNPSPPPYQPYQQQWWWNPPWVYPHFGWVPWQPPDAIDRFLDVLSRYPYVDWAQEGQHAYSQGRYGEAHFYYGLDAIGYAAPFTPVVGPFTRHLTTLGFDPDATLGDRAAAVGGLTWETALLYDAPAKFFRLWGGTVLSNASRIPNSSLYQSFLVQGNTLKTLGDLANGATHLSSFWGIASAIPDAIAAWRDDDDRRLPFDGGPPGGPPGGGFGSGGGWGGDLLGPGGPLFPSDVGGVYLQGAGEALRALGPLAGVAVDEVSGRLVLLAGDGGEIALPPLRLEDLVTVFRSVYEQGEAPYVSIDPDPRDPRGPRMLVRHGALTDQTYVGWVLFEADRLMKAYSLGFDNLTREPVDSGVEGYENLLGLGLSGVDPRSGAPIWERFWIVPARVERTRVGRGELTLLDVPLEVQTQRMVLRGGRLEPAPGAEPSAEATAFASWFTRRYEEIAREARSLPPAELGAARPVEVFAELQRVALLAAIAEALRDQGVPAPAWMRQVEVAPVTVDRTTPAITVEASGSERRALAGGGVATVERRLQIYGGVNLSPPDEAVVTVAPTAAGREIAARLLPAARGVPPLTPIALEQDGRPYTALALPGAAFREVGGQRLATVDLEVPVGAGARLRLERRFSSFFRPSGLLGTSWTLDLPRLERGRRPLGRSGDEVALAETYRLSSPLGSVSATLAETRWVPELGIETVAAADSAAVLGLLAGDDRRIGGPTSVVAFRDGRRWHFDPAGALAARERGPLLEVFRHDDAGCLRRIEGWFGDNLRADVQLTCDADGRLASAAGSNGDEVRYSFDDDGCLARVEGPGETSWEYECDDSQVVRVARDGRELARFEYGPRGVLVRRQADGGAPASLRRTATPTGLEVEVTGAGVEGGGKVLYDAAMRPLRWQGGGDHEIRWSYPEEGGSEASERLPQGGEVAWSRSPDGATASWRLPSQGRVEARLDGAGRIAELRQEGRVVARQEWSDAGQLAAAEFETFTVRPRYRPDLVLEGLRVTSPDGGADGRWLDLAYDELGRVVGMTDGSGLEVQVGYGAGGPEVLASSRGWVRLERDGEGRVAAVETSWGTRQRNRYDPVTGALRRAEIARGSALAVTEFENGRPIRVDGADVTHYRLRYDGDRLAEIEGPEGLRLAYEYAESGRVSAVSCGEGCRIEYDYDDQGRLTRMTRRADGG